ISVVAFEAVLACEGAVPEYPAATAPPATVMTAATVSTKSLGVMSFSCTKLCFAMSLPAPQRNDFNGTAVPGCRDVHEPLRLWTSHARSGFGAGLRGPSSLLAVARAEQQKHADRSAHRGTGKIQEHRWQRHCRQGDSAAIRPDRAHQPAETRRPGDARSADLGRIERR